MTDFMMVQKGSSRAAGYIWPLLPTDENIFLLGFNYRTEVESFALSPSGSLWKTVAARIERDRDPLITTALSPRASVFDWFQTGRGNEQAARLLESWRSGDEREQTATWAFLKAALDKDRLAYRKLFS